MCVPYIILLSWPSVCQILSNMVEICQSSDKNKLRHFNWTTLYVYWGHYVIKALLCSAALRYQQLCLNHFVASGVTEYFRYS